MARRAAASDGYQGVELNSFGGLDLRKDPQEGPVPAIDLVNVDFDLNGRVRSRDGVANLHQGASSTTADNGPLFPFRSGADVRIVWRHDGVMYAVNPATGSSTENASGSPRDAVAIGAPGTTGVLYLAMGSASVLYKYVVGGFTSVTGTPSATYVTVQQPDNRLVTVGAGSSNPNRVSFSNPNAPETFGTDDYVDLAPGDGTWPIGAAFWNNLTFVFKPNTIFVFYGNSTDSTGGAVFNYRTVYHNLPPLPIGTSPYADRVIAGLEGVYFLTRDGVYLTTGGQPAKISEPLDPLFNESAFSDDYFSGDAFDLTKMRLYYGQRRLFLVADAQVYVFTPQQRSWTLWDFGTTVGAMAGLSPASATGGREEYIFSYTASSKASLAKSSSSLATDFGAAMTSGYQTGFLDLGDGGAQKRVREWLLHGSGSFTVRTAVNDQAAFEAAAATPLGPFGGGPVKEYRHRIASRARNISMRVDSTSAWSLSRAIANVASQRPESVRG